MTNGPFLTTAEVAARYRTSPSTVRYWRHAGIGPRGVKIGTRVLYRESELIRWERERDAEQNGTDGASGGTPPPAPVAAEPVELPGKLARELACLDDGDAYDGWTVVEVEGLGHSRWESHHRLIIRNEAGEHFAGIYSKGLTEYQDTHPWEGQSVARFDPVMPRTRVVEVVEYVPADQVEPQTGGEG